MYITLVLLSIKYIMRVLAAVLPHGNSIISTSLPFYPCCLPWTRLGGLPSLNTVNEPRIYRRNMRCHSVGIYCSRHVQNLPPSKPRKKRKTLLWLHNGRDGVLNYQPHDCLLNRLFSADQRKHQSSASLAFVWGIHWWPVNSPHKWPVTRKCFHLMTSSCYLDHLHKYWDVRCTWRVSMQAHTHVGSMA